MTVEEASGWNPRTWPHVWDRWCYHTLTDFMATNKYREAFMADERNVLIRDESDPTIVISRRNHVSSGRGVINQARKTYEKLGEYRKRTDADFRRRDRKKNIWPL